MEDTTLPKSVNGEILEAMKTAFTGMNESVVKSRELSLAVTNLEQAMMWFNKFRTIQGELNPNPTHVEGK